MFSRLSKTGASLAALVLTSSALTSTPAMAAQPETSNVTPAAQ